MPRMCRSVGEGVHVPGARVQPGVAVPQGLDARTAQRLRRDGELVHPSAGEGPTVAVLRAGYEPMLTIELVPGAEMLQ